MIRLAVPGSYLDGLAAVVLGEVAHAEPDRVAARRVVGFGPDGTAVTEPLRAFVVHVQTEVAQSWRPDFPGWKPQLIVFEDQVVGGLDAALADVTPAEELS